MMVVPKIVELYFKIFKGVIYLTMHHDPNYVVYVQLPFYNNGGI